MASLEGVHYDHGNQGTYGTEFGFNRAMGKGPRAELDIFIFLMNPVDRQSE